MVVPIKRRIADFLQAFLPRNHRILERFDFKRQRLPEFRKFRIKLALVVLKIAKGYDRVAHFL